MRTVKQEAVIQRRKERHIAAQERRKETNKRMAE